MKERFFSFSKFFVFITFFLFLSQSFCSCREGKYKLPVKNLVIEKSDGSTVNVRAEIAERQEERNYGFMNRKNIPDGSGMLFVFEYSQVLSFWMKDTPTPLSIAYIDRDGKICDILNMTPFSLRSIISSSPVLYALEVPQGWFTRVGVKKGDHLLLDFK